MPDGIIIIDKPTGWTSMDVCAKLRGILREKRIGHAGTLDPMATGVLPVFVGRATKAVQFAENGRKEYRAVLKLGTVTDTQDTTGAVLEAHPVTVGADEVRAALEHFTGELLQLPPMYSALKVNGQKLYDLARQGKTVERKPRAITVYELELLEQSAPDEFTLRVVCSKGTYIRTLCHDLGQALGCGGRRSAKPCSCRWTNISAPARALPCRMRRRKSAPTTATPSSRAASRTGNTAFTTARGTSSRSPARRAASCTPSRISFEENRP